jgi:hypothetical protein
MESFNIKTLKIFIYIIYYFLLKVSLLRHLNYLKSFKIIFIALK